MLFLIVIIVEEEITENRFQKYRRLHKDICNQRQNDWRKKQINNPEYKIRINKTNEN
jgi:hypothetical protein